LNLSFANPQILAYPQRFASGTEDETASRQPIS
jgi:hypothetical protein